MGRTLPDLVTPKYAFPHLLLCCDLLQVQQEQPLA
jgi:hypothetical protein